MAHFSLTVPALFSNLIMADAKGVESEIFASASDGSPVEDSIAGAGPSGVPVKASRWRKFLGFFWDTFDGDLRDRRYVQKLDSYLL